MTWHVTNLSGKEKQWQNKATGEEIK